MRVLVCVSVCVGGGWSCSIHSIAIDLHVCKRGESLALLLLLMFLLFLTLFFYDKFVCIRDSIFDTDTLTPTAGTVVGAGRRKRWGEL